MLVGDNPAFADLVSGNDICMYGSQDGKNGICLMSSARIKACMENKDVHTVCGLAISSVREEYTETSYKGAFS